MAVADRLFMTYGFKRVTMDEIARELGISKKTIYQYFKDKDEIVFEVTRTHIEEEERIIIETSQQANNAVEELLLISQRIRQQAAQMSPYILFDLKKYYKSSWELFLKFKKEVFHDCIKSFLEDGIEQGYFRPEIDTELLTILRLEEVQLSFDTSVFPPDQFDFKEVQIQLFDHFVHGVLTEKGRSLYNEYISNTNAHAA